MGAPFKRILGPLVVFFSRKFPDPPFAGAPNKRGPGFVPPLLGVPLGPPVFIGEFLGVKEAPKRRSPRNIKLLFDAL